MIFSVTSSPGLTIHLHPAPWCHQDALHWRALQSQMLYFPFSSKGLTWETVFLPLGIYPLFRVFYVAQHQVRYSCPHSLGGASLEWESIFLHPLKKLLEITELWVFPPPCTGRNLLSLVLVQLIILSFPHENAEGLWSWWFQVLDRVNRLLNVSLGRLSSAHWALVSVWVLSQGGEGKTNHLLLFWVKRLRLEEVHLVKASPLGFTIQWSHQLLILTCHLKKKKTFSWMFIPWAVPRTSLVMAWATFAGCKLVFCFSNHHP